MHIVGLVARALSRHYPDWLRNVFFPPGSELLAASHDVGKMTPAFQEKLYRTLANYTWNSLPELADKSIADPEKEHLWGGHANASALALEGLGLSEKACSVVGRHHGIWNRPAGYLVGHESLGGDVWQRKQEQALEQLGDIFQCPWPTVRDRRHAAVLAGLTTAADWVGSGQRFAQGDNSAENMAAALRDAGFILPSFLPDLTFEEVFSFPPNKTQQALAAQCTGPGLYFVEAPMGMGKTEAALYAAYLALSRGWATGVYFALPTQLTSNRIYDRFTPFLEKILAPESASVPAMLLHGLAFLERTDMGEEGQLGSSWYSSLKRAILAPFGVGTLDQALLSALPDVRHSFVRVFGLLGKVVILDEIHSYDAYTSSLIRDFLRILKELRCTVFILSATLTSAKRRELIGAECVSLAYPLVSAVRTPIEAEPLFERHNAASPVEDIAIPAERTQTVFLHMTSSYADAAMEARNRASAGHQVLWIENTVRDAQERFRLFQARSTDEGYSCGLLHSRFVQRQRQANEAYWIGLYGKKCDKRGSIGRILVGTQVLEQSLDIDADCLFTALCPMDMLFQRLGRLWRHERQRPLDARPEAFILLPHEEEAALFPGYFGAGGKVYAPYVLYRTMRALSDLRVARLPEDIRPTLEAVYREQDEQGQPALWLKEWRNRADQLDRLAKSAMAERGQQRSDDEEYAQTRYSDTPTVTVLIAQSLCQKADGVRLVFSDGQELAVNNADCPLPERKRIAGALMLHTVTVSEYLAPRSDLPRGLATVLRRYVYLGKRSDRFRVAVVERSGVLRGVDGHPPNDTYELRYTDSLGYVAKKRGTDNG